MYGPICLIQRFEEVFEKILEKADAGGEIDVNVAIIFENEPGNVGNGEIIFGVATTMFKISWKVVSKVCSEYITETNHAR